MLPFRMKCQIQLTVPQDAMSDDKSEHTEDYDEEDFNLMIIPNSVYTILVVDRFDIDNLPQKD